MSKIYISNNRIISSFYSGYQPFPRSWEMDEAESKATLIFGPNRISLTNEIWNKIFKEMMVVEGICSRQRAYALNVKSFSLDPEEESWDRKGIVVEYSYDVGNCRIS